MRLLKLCCALALAVALSSKTIQAAWPKAQTDDQRAAQLVQQALEAEVEGDLKQRSRLLQEAIKISPDFAPARWQLGQVHYATKWRSLYEIEKIFSEKKQLAEYRQLRKRVKPNAQSHIALADWCEKNALEDQRRAHLLEALRCKPGDKRIIQRLDLIAHHGRLISKDELTRQKEREKQAHSKSKYWQEHISKHRRDLKESSETQRFEALRQLRSIDDPAAIPALEAAFLPWTPTQSIEEREIRLNLIRVIGKMPQFEATVALTRQAVYCSSPDIRSAATDQLKRRSLHEYVPLLIAGMTSPIKTGGNIVATRRGTLYTHKLYREGPNSDSQQFSQRYQGWRSATQEATKIERAVQKENSKVLKANQPFRSVLAATTGLDCGIEPVNWWRWWKEFNELYVSETKPVYIDYFTNSGRYQLASYTTRLPASYITLEGLSNTKTVRTLIGQTSRTFLMLPNGRTISSTSHTIFATSCFVAGTEVWTLTGPVAIEDIRPGDRVLSQDADTGELAYKSVLATTLRPADQLKKIGLEADSITVTRGHPFWVTGRGWLMAKALKVGDRLQSVNGSVVIDQLADTTPELTYNLVVEDFHTYFVGARRILVHDNKYRRPTTALVPGLARKTIGDGFYEFEYAKRLDPFEQFLERLKGKSKLEHLDLSHINIVRRGTSFREKPIITDNRLAFLKDYSKLESLNLSGTLLTDAGLVHLAGLTRLQVLDLGGTHVTDAGLVHLEGLKELMRLDLNNTQVTVKGVKKLLKSLPHCEISFNGIVLENKTVFGDKAKLQGAWRLEHVETGGKQTNFVWFELVFSHGSIEQRKIKRGGALSKFRFKVDSTKDPKHIDFGWTRGIYRLSGDTLELCFSASPNANTPSLNRSVKRPAQFKVELGSETVIWVLKKK